MQEALAFFWVGGTIEEAQLKIVSSSCTCRRPTYANISIAQERRQLLQLNVVVGAR